MKCLGVSLCQGWPLLGVHTVLFYERGLKQEHPLKVIPITTKITKIVCIFRLSVRWKNAKAYVIAVSQILAVPCIVGVLLAPSPTISYGLLFLAYVTAETWLGPAAAIVQVYIMCDCYYLK